MANKQFYEIQVRAPDIGFTVSINDVSVQTDRFQTFSQWSQSVNQWIVKGDNVCRVLLYAGPKQESGFGPEKECRAEIVKITAVDGNPVNESIASATWKYQPDMSWPQQIEIHFDPAPPFAADWEWTRADILSDADLADPSLQSFVVNLNRTMDTKDYSALKPLLETKARELAAAYQIPIETRFADQEEFFLEFFAEAGWGMLQIDWPSVVFEFHAQKRIVQLMTAQGKPLLASVNLADNSQFRLGLYLYRIDGTWKLAR